MLLDDVNFELQPKTYKTVMKSNIITENPKYKVRM